MVVTVGARGFNCDTWRGRFYPEDMPPEWCIAYYANEIKSVMLLKSDMIMHKDLLAECLDELDEDFFLLLEDVPLAHQIVEPSERNDMPLVGFCTFTPTGESFDGFTIKTASVKFVQDSVENACAVVVAADMGMANKNVKLLLEHLHTHYKECSQLFVFFEGAIGQASSIKTAQTISDLMLPHSEI